MSDLIEVKTADLAGEALGWAVAKAESLDLILEPPQYGNPWRVFARYQGEAAEHTKRYNPWEDWAQGGPLIEKHRGGMSHEHRLADTEVRWSGGPAEMGYWCYGPTPLVAFCRSLVSLKLGRHVKVPKKLDIGVTT